jgi:hypothetical protein
MIICDIILLIFLIIIAVQDIRNREVSWYLFPMAFSVILVKALSMLPYEELFFNFSMNLMFIGLQLIVLFSFYAMKNKKFINIINKYIGIGDLIFFVLLCAGFSPLVFGCYLVASFLFAIIAFYVVNIFIKKSISTIPLAGGLALSYSLLLIAGLFFKNLNLYNDLQIGDIFVGLR